MTTGSSIATNLALVDETPARGTHSPAEQLTSTLTAQLRNAVDAIRFLREKHKDRYHDHCWVSANRGQLEIDWDGDDSLGFDFRVQTIETEWRYEVKSNLDDAFEFEFTQNEMRIAAECAADGSRRYRILYVPFAFDPTRWRVMELPNPMSERGRRLVKVIGTGATRFRFEPS